MDLRVQSESSVHTAYLCPHEVSEVRGPWAEVTSTGATPLVVVGMAAIDRSGGRVKVDVGTGPPGKERSLYTVRLPVDQPPFLPEVRGLTEEMILPAGSRIVARYVREDVPLR